jgi:lipoate-protein ligase A
MPSSPRKGKTSSSLPVWRRLDLGVCDPYRAQTFVESVAVSVGRGEAPNTVLYARPRRPYVSLGFHQSASEELDEEEVVRRNLPILRRVTGGGTTYLDPDQVFYQLVWREGDPRGERWSGAGALREFLRGPRRALRDLGLEAEFREPADLVIRGRKVSGNAGGDWEGAHILVGGVLGHADTEAMAAILRCPDRRFRALLEREMQTLLTGLDRELPGPVSLETLPDRIDRAFAKEGLFRSVEGPPLEAEERRFVEEVGPRHRDPSWIQIPPVPRDPGPVVRSVRVAGPWHVWMMRGEVPSAMFWGTSEGPRVVRAYRGSDEPSRDSEIPLKDGEAGWGVVQRLWRAHYRD